MMYRNLITVVRVSVGIMLLMLGIIGLLLPVLQGWLLIFVAIPIISPRHGKQMVAKLKEWGRKLTTWWRKRKGVKNGE